MKVVLKKIYWAEYEELPYMSEYDFNLIATQSKILDDRKVYPYILDLDDELKTIKVFLC